MIRSVIGDERVVLHEPLFRGNESKYVCECIETGWVSSVGAFVDRFEEDLQEITGAKKAVAVSNGTSALFIALKLCGVQQDDEVIVPALTFVATANAVAHCNAIPHLVDCETQTLGIDPHKLDIYLNDITKRVGSDTVNKKTGRRISAMVPMHCLGHPSQIGPLVDLSKKYSLKLIEDAAESLGSYYNSQHTGTFGDIGIFSFNGNKTITTGGGGAIVTNNHEIGKLAKHLTTTAKVPHSWDFFHDHVGYNFRMPNLNAALGCAQLESLDAFLDAKRRLASTYSEAFSNSEFVDFVTEPENCKSNYWLNAIVLKPEYQDQHDATLEFSNHQGIMTRPAWKLMHQLPMYEHCPRMNLEVSESIQSRLINIPSGPGIILGKIEP